MAEFEPAVEWMLSHEGGYVNDPNDAGGETKYGISKRSYPDVDIAALTLDDAKAIYKRDYWASQRYEEIADQRVATKIFDMAVNMGFHRAHAIAQQQCGVKNDGILGPLTVAAINAKDADTFVVSLCNACVEFYSGLAEDKPTNQKFLNGWLKRANDVPPVGAPTPNPEMWGG